METKPDLASMVIGAMQRVETKVDDLRDRVTRVEEKQSSSKEAADHRHNNSKMSMEALIAQISGLKGTIESADDKHDALVIRVVKVEDATNVLKDALAELNKSARWEGLKGGWIVTTITSAFAAALTFFGWLFGWVQITPKPPMPPH